MITYSQRQAHIRQAAEVRCREHLERQDSISGSAVLPNASRDATYRQRMATLRLQTHNRIRMACSTDGGGQ